MLVGSKRSQYMTIWWCYNTIHGLRRAPMFLFANGVIQGRFRHASRVADAWWKLALFAWEEARHEKMTRSGDKRNIDPVTPREARQSRGRKISTRCSENFPAAS